MIEQLGVGEGTQHRGSTTPPKQRHQRKMAALIIGMLWLHFLQWVEAETHRPSLLMSMGQVGGPQKASVVPKSRLQAIGSY